MVELSDRNVFQHIVGQDEFHTGACVQCRRRGGLFVVRGRYVTLCPWCVQHRIDLVDLQLGGLPGDIQRLKDEADSEINMQLQMRAQALPVEWRRVWRCDRCGSRMHRYEVRLIPAGGMRQSTSIPWKTWCRAWKLPLRRGTPLMGDCQSSGLLFDLTDAALSGSQTGSWAPTPEEAPHVESSP